MRVSFIERDEKGFYVYLVDSSHVDDPADPEYPVSLAGDQQCVVIVSGNRRCELPELENGLCHVHSPNATYFKQNHHSAHRIRTSHPLIGDESYKDLPEQDALF